MIALSDLGLRGYLSYWSYTLASALMETKQGSLSIRDLSQITYIHPDDIIITFRSLGIVINYQGQPIIHLNVPADTSRENQFAQIEFKKGQQ